MAPIFRSIRDVAGRIQDTFNETVTVDERHTSVAVAIVQRTHEQRLGCLVFGKEEHGPVGERLIDHGQYARDLRLVGDLICRREQLLEGRDLVRVQVDSTKALSDQLFQAADLVEIGRVVLSSQLLQARQILLRFFQLGLRLTEPGEPSSKSSPHGRDGARRQFLHRNQDQDHHASILKAETGRVGFPGHDELCELFVEMRLLR